MSKLAIFDQCLASNDCLRIKWLIEVNFRDSTLMSPAFQRELAEKRVGSEYFKKVF